MCGAFVLGCGPGHSGGAGSGSAGAGYHDPTPVSDLGPGELHRLCELYEPGAYDFDPEQIRQGGCLVIAIKAEDALGSTLGDCEAYLADCLDPSDEEEDEDEGEDADEECDPDEVDPDVLADCDVTLAEVHACRQATLDQLEAIAHALTCADGVEDLPDAPAACQPLAERCPVLFEE